MRKPTPMAGKLVNIDLWLSRGEEGEYDLWENEPEYDEKAGHYYATGDWIMFVKKKLPKVVFSGLKPGECCRVRLQRMD